MKYLHLNMYNNQMEYEEFKRQLGKSGLSIGEFADLVKLNRKSISNYSMQGGVPSHLAIISVLLAELSRNEIEFKPLLVRLQLVSKKSRGAGKGKFGGNKQINLFSPSISTSTKGK